MPRSADRVHKVVVSYCVLVVIPTPAGGWGAALPEAAAGGVGVLCRSKIRLCTLLRVSYRIYVSKCEGLISETTSSFHLPCRCDAANAKITGRE